MYCINKSNSNQIWAVSDIQPGQEISIDYKTGEGFLGLRSKESRKTYIRQYVLGEKTLCACDLCKEEDDDKAKVGKRSRFLAHLTIINAWLAFSLDEPKPNHHPWNMPMHKKIPDQQYDVIPHNKKLTYFSKILNFRSFRIQIFLIFIYKKSFIIFPDFSTSILIIFCLYYLYF